MPSVVLHRAARWLRDPEMAIAARPPAHHLRLWDALSARRCVPAIGGLDGHQPGIRVRGGVVLPLSLRVRLSEATDVRVVCDGAPLHQARAGALDIEIDARGVYRT